MKVAKACTAAEAHRAEMVRLWNRAAAEGKLHEYSGKAPPSLRRSMEIWFDGWVGSREGWL